MAVHRQVRPPSVDRAMTVRSRLLTVARQEKNATPEYEKYTIGSASVTTPASSIIRPRVHDFPLSNEAYGYDRISPSIMTMLAASRCCGSRESTAIKLSTCGCVA